MVIRTATQLTGGRELPEASCDAVLAPSSAGVVVGAGTFVCERQRRRVVEVVAAEEPADSPSSQRA
jgi:hypothetical protein